MAINTKRELPRLLCPQDIGAYYYGDNEKKLVPSKSHLISLVEYISRKKFKNVSEKIVQRAELFGLHGEEIRCERRKEAIEKIINAKGIPSKWYVLEGNSRPDLYVEGEDYVLLCEGKWTERGITTHTKYLRTEDGEYRNQMVRHIQGALNATDKKIYAFYIVDGDCEYLGDLTEEAFSSQVKLETVAPDNVDDILSSFYGFTTWQALEKAIPSLRFLSKEEIDAIKYSNAK